MPAAIIGAGFLGGEIARQLRESGVDCFVTHHNNQIFPDSVRFDFFADDIADVFHARKIDTVFLTAKIEIGTDPKNLVISMRRFLDACSGKRLIYFSSDGIFDGERGMYGEKDIPHPVTEYGKNLALCENLIREWGGNFYIIRPSYLYGFSNGRLDSRLKNARLTLEAGERLERFTDMYKSPLDVSQVAQASIRLAQADYQGIVHVAGPRMSVYDFVREAMEALDVPTDDLVGTEMPVPHLAGFLTDTSLDFSLMTRLTGIVPEKVSASLKKYAQGKR